MLYDFGYHPDLFDYRDKVLVAGEGAVLPARVEPIDQDFPIYHQETSNACVGFAYKAAAQIVLLRQAGLITALSPHFIWWNARAMLGWDNLNLGCRIRDAIKVGNRLGAASEGTCRWNAAAFATPPSAEAYAQAQDHPAIDYATVETSLDAKVALAGGRPVIFGTVLNTSFGGVKTNGGFFPVPAGASWTATPCSSPGYDDAVEAPGWDEPGAFRVRNSWGPAWADTAKNKIRIPETSAFIRTPSESETPFVRQGCSGFQKGGIGLHQHS